MGISLRINEAASSTLQSPPSLAVIPSQLQGEVGNAKLLLFPAGMD